jgi:PAS domain S-box-containing protein
VVAFVQRRTLVRASTGGQTTPGEERASIAHALHARRELVLRRWEQRVLADPVVPEANGLAPPVLRDHVPEIFDAILDALHTSAMPRSTVVARGFGHTAGPSKHARERLAQGYSTTSALRELSHFRTTVIEVIEETGPLDARTMKIVDVVIDEAMSTAAEMIDAAGKEAILHEQRRLRSVLELLPVGVFVLDAGGAIVETNAAAKSLWGVTSLVGGPKDDAQYEAYWASTGERLRAKEWAAAQMIAKGELVGPQEVDIVTATGERRTILSSAAPLLVDGGRPIGGVAVNVDVTELRRAESSLRAALDDERAAHEALAREAAFRERFIGILGHDLRTPLTAISVGASTLKRGERELTQMRVAERIASAAHRMEGMIRDLLDVTRARHGGGIAVFPKPMRLDEICRAVVDEIELAYPDRTVDLRAEGDCAGEFDADRMAQVVSNLVTNALEYSEPTTAIEVAIDCSAPSEVRLEVHNEGAPIPRASIPSLFDPFTRGSDAGSRSSASKRRKGLGLGLFIVNEIVRAHGGRIEVRSDAEGGTTFEVRLPRR